MSGLFEAASINGVLAADWAPYWRFSGVFHPAVSHFPIALLSVAALVETWSILRRHKHPSQTTLVCLYLGTIAAIVTTTLGWANADAAERRGDIVFTHRWLGVSLSIVAIMTVVLSLFARREKTNRQVFWSYRGFVLAGGALVGLTGMYGGKISFGKDYYKNAYASLQEELKQGAPEATKVAVVSITKSATGSTTQPVPTAPGVALSPTTKPSPTTVPVLAASAAGLGGGTIDFARDIEPIFVAHCVKCHNEEKDKGGYRLDTRERAFAAGESGKVPVIPGKSDESLLVKLIEGKGEFEDSIMPPKGAPLTFQQIALIRRWIDEGSQSLP